MPKTDAIGRPDGHFRYIRVLLRLRLPLAIATMVFALAGLGANYANVDPLLRPLGDRSATHPLTAACLFVIGFSIFKLKRFSPTPWWRYAAGGVIVLTCAARLTEAALAGAGGSAFFGPMGAVHGRFSIESALAIGALTVAAMLRSKNGRVGLVFLVIGLATVFNTLLEISYGLTFFNGDVGAFTLLGLVCVSLAMVTLYIHRPFVRVLFLVGGIGSQTRVMATAAIAVPWVCGYLLNTFQTVGVGLVAFEAAMISVIIWSMVVILLTTSARHEAADAARRRAEREISSLSRKDPLTGALNRFGMSESLDAAWASFRSTNAQFGLILVDLDHFKTINDTYGYYAGDDVLRRVSDVLHPYMRVADALSRWGGEEFLILLQIKDRADLETVAERLRRALQHVNSPYIPDHRAGSPISASFGLSDLRAEDDSPADAITRADSGLYLAKKAGRNRVVSFYDAMAA